MSVLQRILQELCVVLRQENPNELDIYIYCYCQDVAVDGNQGDIGVPHLSLDLSAFGCIALGAKSDFYLKEMKKETSAIMRDEIFVPQISYACRSYYCIQRNLLPAPVPAAED